VIAFTAVQSAADVAVVVRLAREIWYEHYVPIIGRAQVDYMVGKFQSSAAIQDQIASGYEYYLIGQAGEAVGYLGLQAQAEHLFISKLYLLKRTRGTGLGRIAIEFIERLSRERRLPRLALTVNKYNPALEFYLSLGFENCGSVVADIGNGFVMDDYRMERTVVLTGPR
jgi:GNAT superfamily N-acetyltransferase